MMGWTEADNKNPHARRFIIFFHIFSSFFLTQLSRLGLKPYSVNSVSPSLYLVPQRPTSIGHHPSAITRSLCQPFASVLDPQLSLVSPRYPLGYPRRKSAQSLPIITHHLRLPGHVENLQPHVPFVQHTRHPPPKPSVQSQLDPAIRPSGELPRAGRYFQSDRGQLEHKGISFRRNLCCARTEGTDLAASPLVQCVYQQSLPCQSFYVNRPFLILESSIIGSPNARCVI